MSKGSLLPPSSRQSDHWIPLATRPHEGKKKLGRTCEDMKQDFVVKCNEISINLERMELVSNYSETQWLIVRDDFTASSRRKLQPSR